MSSTHIVTPPDYHQSPPPQRSRRGWRIAGAIAASLLVLAALQILIGQTLHQSDRSQWPLPGNLSALTLDVGVGDVQVRPARTGEKPHVSVSTSWSLFPPTTDVRSGATGKATVFSQCRAQWLANSCQVEWEVVVPAGVPVSGNAGVGNVELCDLSGPASLEIGVGDLTVCRSSSESLRAEIGTGTATLDFAAAPSQVNASVGVGDLDITVPDDDTSYRVTTDSGVGDESVRVPTDQSADNRIVTEVGVGSLSVRAR